MVCELCSPLRGRQALASDTVRHGCRGQSVRLTARAA
jgi:hypothetical protein